MWQLVTVPHQERRQRETPPSRASLGSSFCSSSFLLLRFFSRFLRCGLKPRSAIRWSIRLLYRKRALYSTKRPNLPLVDGGEQWLLFTLHLWDTTWCIEFWPGLSGYPHSPAELWVTYCDSQGLILLNDKAGLLLDPTTGITVKLKNTGGLVLLFRLLSNELLNPYTFWNHLKHPRYRETERV